MVVVTNSSYSNPSAPTLNNPSPGASFDINTSISFSWSNISVSRYHLAITNPSNSTVDIYTGNTSYSYTPQVAGTWKWKVRYESDTGTTGDWSSERTFTIAGSSTDPPSTGNVTIQYFVGIQLSGNVIWSETASEINKNWGTGGPGNGVPNDSFSARFSETVTVSGGYYKFHYEVDDAIKIWIDGDCKVDKWGSHVLNEDTDPIYMSAGTHNLKVEYADYGGEAKIYVTMSATSAPTPTVTMPDLQPTAITYDQSDLLVGNTIFFDSGVKNNTSVASGGFNIKWFVNGVELGYGFHDGLSGNATVMDGNSGFYWTPSASGTYTIAFQVDADNGVQETNEDNNWASVVVSVANARVLRQGMTGDDVWRVQEKLHNLGYLNVPATGEFGSRTRAAVMIFQAQHGYSAPNGEVGPWTMGKLYSSSVQSFAVQSTGSNNNAVKIIQKYLIKLGYLNISSATTSFGSRTRIALKVFQYSVGLSATGKADISTLYKLYAAGASKFTVKASRELKYGMSGLDVLSAQLKLYHLGYMTELPNGYYGSVTKAAVIAFQAQNGLEGVTGTVGPWTRGKLNASAVRKFSTMRYGTDSVAVKVLQNYLKRYGYLSVSRTGTAYLSRTQEAVMAFQAANGLSATGIADLKTVIKLYGNTH